MRSRNVLTCLTLLVLSVPALPTGASAAGVGATCGVDDGWILVELAGAGSAQVRTDPDLWVVADVGTGAVRCARLDGSVEGLRIEAGAGAQHVTVDTSTIAADGFDGGRSLIGTIDLAVDASTDPADRVTVLGSSRGEDASVAGDRVAISLDSQGPGAGRLVVEWGVAGTAGVDLSLRGGADDVGLHAPLAWTVRIDVGEKDLAAATQLVEFSPVEGSEPVAVTTQGVSAPGVDVRLLRLDRLTLHGGETATRWRIPWGLPFTVEVLAFTVAQHVEVAGTAGRDRLQIASGGRYASVGPWVDPDAGSADGPWVGLSGRGSLAVDLGAGDDEVEFYGSESDEVTATVHGGRGRDTFATSNSGDDRGLTIRHGSVAMAAGPPSNDTGSAGPWELPLTGVEAWSLEHIVSPVFVDTSDWPDGSEVEVAVPRTDELVVDVAGRRVTETFGAARIGGWGRVTGQLPHEYRAIDPTSELVEFRTPTGVARTITPDRYRPVREALPDPRGRRVAGGDRVETAAALAEDGWWPHAPIVVLARADEYADALTAGPLAKELDAPVLMTTAGGLPPATVATMRRLGTREVVIVGGTAAVGTAVEEALAELGVTVLERIAGRDRFETAAALARRGDLTGYLFVAEGRNIDPRRGWPDAVTAATLGAHVGSPVLLVERDRLPEATASVIVASSPVSITIVGGPAAVGPDVMGEIEDIWAGRPVPIGRFEGLTRYETSAAAVSWLLGVHARPTRIMLATGENWPDALAASARVDGRTVLLMTGPAPPPGEPWPAADVIANWAGTALERPVIEDLVIVGGSRAVDDATVAAYVERLERAGVQLGR